MKKKNIKSLKLNKKKISRLQQNEILGAKVASATSSIACLIAAGVSYLICESDTCISVPNGTNCCPL